MARDLPESRRSAECPNCGAPIAWRLGSSQAAVCSYCRFAVVRSDRDLRTVGKVADLVPSAAPLAIGDEGSLDGRSFRVLGRIQLDHGRGPWDEFYVAFADQTWGWLARAEGRWYLTVERPCPDPPRWDDLPPGARTTLHSVGNMPWVVVERGGSAVISAEGELPFPVDPRGSGRYVDLEAEGQAFATLDFNDGSTPAQLFSGHAFPASSLSLKRAVLGPRPEERVKVAKLACPQCGAPLPIFVPSESERCGCAACGALLDHHQGNLTLLSQLEAPPLAPLLPLGAAGKLFDAERTVIGFMQRHVVVDGERYTFREYLLHAASGYAFLVEENHHWLFVAEVPAAAVRERGQTATYRGVTYKKFARGEPVVDFVVGEFYWKVAAGDRSETADYIAPPRALSMERTDAEVTWSAGEYVAPAELTKAFGVKRLPRPSGIAAAQPNPFAKRGHGWVFTLLALLWFMLALHYELRSGRRHLVYEENVALEAYTAHAGVDGASKSVTSFSSPFTITRDTTTLEVALQSPLDNGWVQVEAALVPEEGGVPLELPVLLEHYTGYEGGESWEEGGTTAEGYFGSVPKGRYALRFVSSWAPSLAGSTAFEVPPPPLRIRATEGARSFACGGFSFILIALPYLLGYLRRLYFEQRRNAQASL